MCLDHSVSGVTRIPQGSENAVTLLKVVRGDQKHKKQPDNHTGCDLQVSQTSKVKSNISSGARCVIRAFYAIIR